MPSSPSLHSRKKKLKKRYSSGGNGEDTCNMTLEIQTREPIMFTDGDENDEEENQPLGWERNSLVRTTTLDEVDQLFEESHLAEQIGSVIRPPYVRSDSRSAFVDPKLYRHMYDHYQGSD